MRYRGTKEYHLVYSELIRAAQYGGLTTYQEIAQIMGLPLTGQHMGSEVTAILREISEDELQHGRPMLSAVVVNVNGKPGKGFYDLAKHLGRMGLADSETGSWNRECEHVYAAWKRTYGGR
jgi:alkylated DNA nucleotide flippase Atl1